MTLLKMRVLFTVYKSIEVKVGTYVYNVAA